MAGGPITRVGSIFPALSPTTICPASTAARTSSSCPPFTIPQGNVDGLPNVILEALASGLPVVATTVSGISPGRGIGSPRESSFRSRTAPALREAVAGLLGNPEQRRRMGARARARAVAQLTWDIVAGRYRQAYVDAMADGARR